MAKPGRGRLSPLSGSISGSSSRSRSSSPSDSRSTSRSRSISRSPSCSRSFSSSSSPSRSVTSVLLNQLGEVDLLLPNLKRYLHPPGPIPETFSNLTQVESLDLSHNKLAGDIPPQLIQLHFLSIFSVAYNNLSGMTPEMKDQFLTFEASSYEGNRFLCGPPLQQNCSSIAAGRNKPPHYLEANDFRSALWTFAGAFGVFFCRCNYSSLFEPLWLVWYNGRVFYGSGSGNRSGSISGIGSCIRDKVVYSYSILFSRLV